MIARMRAFHALSLAGLLMPALLFGCAGAAHSVLEDLPHPPAIIPPDAPPPTPSQPAPAGLDADEAPLGWVPPVPQQQWQLIVVHHSAGEGGNAAKFDEYHRSKGWDELGYHFVITNGNGGPDGGIEIGSRWTKQKWGAHTGGTPNNEYNNAGIGVCLVGDFTDHMPTPAQLQSLRRLCVFLMRRYGIAPADVIGHRDGPGASTECPGNTFHPYLITEFRQGLADETPAP